MLGRVLVFDDGARSLRVGRTARAFAAADVDAPVVLDRSTLARTLARERTSGTWIVRAGAWPVELVAPQAPPSSATGRGLCALGAARAHAADGDAAPEVRAWERALQATGGDLAELSPRAPPLYSFWIDAALREKLARALGEGLDLDDAVVEASRGARVVHYEPLDVFVGGSLRVAEVVTSLQRGGAEQVVVDLAGELPRRGIRTCLTTLGSPLRSTLQPPEPALDLARARIPHGRERIDHLGRALVAWGADAAHVHLLDAEDVTRLAASGVPIVATVHNARPGWPEGLDGIGPGSVRLFVACSRAVERDLRAAGLAPVRTVHNGIDAGRFAPDPARALQRPAWRERLGLGDTDVLLLALANVRPQKRLERLPPVLAAVDRALAGAGERRRAVLVVAGSASGASPGAIEARDRLDRASVSAGMTERVVLAGEVEDVAGLLAATDVLVSTSAWEGLSLAHLEARVAGVPVVATDAGGTREIAERDPGVSVLPVDADADTFAAAVVSAIREERPPPSAWATRSAMADGYARLLSRAACTAPRPRGGLVLVTNNFSTGGAQSSARRLLCGLAAAGFAVTAITIEEDPEHPTPGRSALVASGVPVVAVPPPLRCPAPRAVLRVLDEIASRAPSAVIFWNAMAEHKVLLAEALFDVPVFDVSPGETYFDSLEHFFASRPPGVSHAGPRDYGARLAGVIVKYEAEARRAADVLGARVHVVPNGVRIPEAAVSPGPLEGRRLVIGTLARIARHKRLEDLVEALRIATPALPPHVLRIAGGVERGAEEYARQMESIGRGLAIEWLGDVGDVPGFLAGLDLFALVAEPSGCPNASLEALAHGLPVVATDVGGMREQLLDGTTGRLVSRGDTSALASALVELARSADLRARLGAAGRAHAASRFSLERMIRDYTRVLDAGTLSA